MSKKAQYNTIFLIPAPFLLGMDVINFFHDYDIHLKESGRNDYKEEISDIRKIK